MEGEFVNPVGKVGHQETFVRDYIIGTSWLACKFFSGKVLH